MSDDGYFIREVAIRPTTVGTHLEEGTGRGFAFDEAESDTMEASAIKPEIVDVRLTGNFRHGKVLVKVDRISTLLPCQQEDTGKLMETQLDCHNFAEGKRTRKRRCAAKQIAGVRY